MNPDWQVKKQGRSMISRTGQSCYVKNRLLSKENVALSLQDTNSPNALSKFNNFGKVDKARLSLQKSRSLSFLPMLIEEEELKFFKQEFAESLDSEVREDYLKSQAVQLGTLQAKQQDSQKIRETRVCFGFVTFVRHKCYKGISDLIRESTYRKASL